MIRLLTTSVGAAFVLLALGCGNRAPAPEARPAVGAARDSFVTAASPGSGERSITLEIGGMICQDCADKVQRSLASVDGVHRVHVSLDDRLATVVADSVVADTALTGAVRRAGAGYLGFVRH
jgi:copper chaperone CopZ